MPISPPAAPGRCYRLLGVAAFLGLSLYVLCQRKPAFFDEVPYLDLAAKLATARSVPDWLLHDYLWPAGPLHPMMHYWLSGGGGLPAPWLRVPNLVLLGCTASMLGWLAWPKTTAGWQSGFTLILSMPMAWTISGMALTEIPAMTAFTVALLAAVLVHRDSSGQSSWRHLQLLMMGLGLGVAICGRQTFLVTAPFIIWLALSQAKQPLRLALWVVPGLVPAALLFLTWKGLSSPRVDIPAGIRPIHAVYALCYLGSIAFWLAPQLWVTHWRWSASAAIIASVANIQFQWVHLTTLSSAQKYMPFPLAASALEQLLAVVAVGAGASFLVLLLRVSWLNRDRSLWISALCMLLLCTACAGITHQFSSRYIATAFPLLVLWSLRWIDTGTWAVLRATGGMLAGFASLHSYYLN